MKPPWRVPFYTSRCVVILVVFHFSVPLVDEIRRHGYPRWSTISLGWSSHSKFHVVLILSPNHHVQSPITIKSPITMSNHHWITSESPVNHHVQSPLTITILHHPVSPGGHHPVSPGFTHRKLAPRLMFCRVPICRKPDLTSARQPASRRHDDDTILGVSFCRMIYEMAYEMVYEMFQNDCEIMFDCLGWFVMIYLYFWWFANIYMILHWFALIMMIHLYMDSLRGGPPPATIECAEALPAEL